MKITCNPICYFPEITSVNISGYNLPDFFPLCIFIHTLQKWDHIMQTVTYFSHSTIYCEHQHIQIHIAVLNCGAVSHCWRHSPLSTELILSRLTVRFPMVCHQKQRCDKYSWIHISTNMKEAFLEMELSNQKMCSVKALDAGTKELFCHQGRGRTFSHSLR